jgi:peptidoglycan hydrolase CwlO-like protein
MPVSKTIIAGLSLISLIASSFVFSTNAMAATADEIAQKNAQIQELQRQISEYQKQIDSVHGQAQTLQGEIKSLTAQINQINLELQSLNLSISNTNLQIQDTQSKIGEAEDKMGKDQDSLGQYMRILYQNDQESLTAILIKHDNLSDFFSELNNVKTIQDDLKVTIQNLSEIKTDLEETKQELQDRKAELAKQQALVSLEKSSAAQIKAKKDKLLADTKGQESKYQELVKKNQRDIEAIRAQIGYLLQNGVSAEDAVKYGQLAALAVNIRPAFLLAELEQESALGNNVGKCYIVDTTSGTTRRVSGEIYTKGIHPTRDLGLFLNITAELGRDPFTTPISCGQGWGGAMGAAQFIPSTWMGYRDRISAITGNRPADPWNIEDAFAAAAAKLSHDGADSNTREGEIAASKRYYCGNAASTSAGCINYANSVQRLATQIEQNL